ncbi:MAG: hypothetical protein ACREBH_02360 [Candidatus Micrarchaeaceae archaeon]
MQAIYMHQYYALLAPTLPITPTNWIGFATLAVLVVIFVAAMVYMLSGIINSRNARNWSRFQIYEACLSLFLLLIFSSVIYIFFLSPQNTFGAAGLVPPDCTSASTIFALSSCDVAQFNNATFSLSEYIFFSTYLTSAVLGWAPTITITPIPLNPNINLAISPPSLFPSSTDKLMGLLYGAMVFALVFNQLQLIMLSAALLFLGFFLSVGLVARTLGFARSFGGAMIAFGIGLGIIYPLLTSIMYGYIDIQANVVCLQSFTCGLTTIFSTIISILFNVATLSTGNLAATVGSLFIYTGYIILGVVIVPLINIAIVDAFIIDFSSAVGERMSFGQLFTNII